MSSVFISYSHNNKNVVHCFADKLLEEKLNIWIDRDKLDIGDNLTKTIEEGIISASYMICFISKSYINSRMCRLELSYANNIKKKCFYILLEKIDRKTATGITIFLYGEELRFDAYKHFDENIQKYAENIFEKLKKALFRNEETVISADSFIDSYESVLPKRDDFFAFREEIISELDDVLKMNSLVILFGLPGVGKTSIVIEYIHRKIDAASIKDIFWFNADTSLKINEMMYTYGKNLRINFTITDRKTIISNFLNHLNNLNNCVCVFDNLEKEDDISLFINSKTVKSKIIVTTRKEKIAFAKAKKIKVQPFSTEVSKRFLMQHLPDFTDQQIGIILKEIIVDNECLPYKINCVTSMLLNNWDMTVDTVFKFANLNFYMSKIVENVQAENKFSVELLKYTALLDPDYISLSLVKHIIGDGDFKNAVEILLKSNICMIVYPNTERCGIRIHRLLQNDLQSIYEIDKNEEIMDRCAQILNEFFPFVTDDPSTWGQSEIFLTHTVKFQNVNRLFKKNLFVLELQNKLAVYYRNVLQDFQNSEKFAKESLIVCDQLYEGDHPNKAKSLSTLADSLTKLGNDKKAAEYYKQSLEMRQRLYEGDHHDIAESLNNLGISYSRLGYDDKAVDYYKQALQIRQRLYACDHPEIAKSLNNIGISYTKLGNDRNAADYYKQSLEMKQRIYKDDHPEIAKSLNNIGISYTKLGDDKTAAGYFMQSLELRQRLYKSDHPYVAQALNNLAFSFEKLGEFQKALEYQEKSLNMRQRLYNGDHPEVAQSLNNIGTLYTRLGNDQKATECHQQSLEIKQRLYQGDHPDIAQSLNNIGVAYGKLGFFRKASEYHEKSLEIRLRFYKGDHPDIAYSLNKKGVSKINLEDNVEAAKYLEQALEIRQRLYKGDHPDIAESLNNMGISYTRSKNEQKAADYLMTALEMRQRLYKSDHHDTAESLNNMGVLFVTLRCYEKCAEYFEKSLEMRKKLYEGDHPEIAKSLNNLGVLYSGLGDDEKSVEYYKQSLEMRQRLYKDDHPEIAQSLNNIGLLYEKLGSYEKAAEYHIKALKIKRKFCEINELDFTALTRDVCILLSRLEDEQKISYQIEETKQKLCEIL